MSTFVTFMVVGVLLIGGTITFQVLAWKGNETIHWILTFVMEVISNIIYFILMCYFNSEASMVRDHMSNALNASVPYAKFAVVCLMIALFFLGMTLISIVLAIGRHMMTERGEY